ncbi:lithostathine-like isoform X2 [Mytilus edulis]|uniref:lithostathine-like isoform X2 n=1 Tax=Mytilus edulis TaxID=6550 RepID=UPI0039F1269A
MKIMFRYYILTLVLVALTVQSIQITCNDPEIRTCGNASVLIDVGGNAVGAKTHLSCFNGYTLWGNDSIVCLDSGKWSQLNSYCIPDDIGDPNIQSFDGSLYFFNNITLRNYNQAKEYCTKICSTLIEINNQEEDQFLRETIKNLEFETAEVWIGIESVNGGNFSWQSGNTTLTNMYDNWKEGDPPKGTCAFQSRLKTTWTATYSSCVAPLVFVCEFGNN